MMRAPQTGIEIYLLGFLVAAIFIAAVVFVLLRFDQKAFLKRKKLERNTRAGVNRDLDLSGGRDVSAALGVQQSTGLKVVRDDRDENDRREVF